MGYRSALLLVITSAILTAQAPLGEGNSLDGPLTVFLRSDGATSPGVVQAMEREVEDLVAPAGIRVSWNSAKGSQKQETYARVAVVHLCGACTPGLPVSAVRSAAGQETEALGQTQVADGRVLPFADVRCNSVRRLIGRELLGTAATDRDELLGRALGRVMAHELYHVLLRTTSHGRSGLARPVQSSSDLVAPRDTFAEADERKLSESGRAETTASSIRAVR